MLSNMLIPLLLILLPSVSAVNLTLLEIYSDYEGDVAKTELQKILENFVKPVEVTQFGGGQATWNSSDLDTCVKAQDFIKSIKQDKTREWKIQFAEHFTMPTSFITDCYDKRTIEGLSEDLLRKEYETLKAERASAVDKAEELELELRNAKMRIDSLEQDLNESKARNEQLNADLDEASRQLNATDIKLAERDKTLEEVGAEVADSKRRNELLQDELNRLQADLKRYEDAERRLVEKRQLLDKQSGEKARDHQAPSYGKYIGLAVGFVLVVAYLAYARFGRGQGTYELHSN